MFWFVAAAAVFTIVVGHPVTSPCPCSSASLCEPIQYDGREAFGYVYESNRTLWETFHWDKLTTIAMIDFFDPDLYCMARVNNARVMKRETFSLSTLTNDTLVKVWIQQKVDFAVEHYLDGVNLYVDDALDKNIPDREKLTEFVKQLTLAFHGQLPHSMVVFNVPWSPINQIGKPVEGKNYDYLSISKIVDRVLIMEYEQKLQNFDSICQARPNIDLYYAIGGVWAWANTTINMSRTILGLPCYTHDYVCVKTAENYYCEVEPHEYRGVKCSSRVAKRIPYNQLDQYIKEHNIDNGFDEHADISVALYHNKEDNMTHQIWIYDDDERIGLEFVLLDEFEMNGVAMFPVNGIDERMWKRIPKYKTSYKY